MKKQTDVTEPCSEITGTKLFDKVYLFGQEYLCPVCGKTFKFTSEHSYIIKHQYTCSWKCFLDRVNARASENKEKKPK